MIIQPSEKASEGITYLKNVLQDLTDTIEESQESDRNLFWSVKYQSIHIFGNDNQPDSSSKRISWPRRSESKNIDHSAEKDDKNGSKSLWFLQSYV